MTHWWHSPEKWRISPAEQARELQKLYDNCTDIGDKVLKHPEVKVELSAVNGNVFAVLGEVVRALRAAKVPEPEISDFYTEATCGDYDQALQTCMRWVDVS